MLVPCRALPIQAQGRATRQSISAESVSRVVLETDLWVCSYCVAENALRLRDSDFAFFRELFAEAQGGSFLSLLKLHIACGPR